VGATNWAAAAVGTGKPRVRRRHISASGRESSIKCHALIGCGFFFTIANYSLEKKDVIQNLSKKNNVLLNLASVYVYVGI
jgi:hypothetical protein